MPNPGDVSGCGMVCLAPHANGGFQSPDNVISEWDGLTEWTDYFWCGKSSTNNTAEWWGVLAAVRRAIREGKFGLTVLMDSQLVVRQFDQSCTVSDHLKPFCRELWAMRDEIRANGGYLKLVHRRRKFNTRADRYATLATMPGHGQPLPADLIARMPPRLHPYANAPGQGVDPGLPPPLPAVRGLDRR